MGVEARSVEADAFYRSRFQVAARWAVGLCGDPDVAQDIAQEVMVRVSARLGEVDDPDAYLRRAVVNACRSWRRSEFRRARRERLVATGDPVEAAVTDVEMLDALSRLVFRQRAALVLRHWSGWTDDEISEALGCRASTVRVLAHRGARRLARDLKGDAQ